VVCPGHIVGLLTTIVTLGLTVTEAVICAVQVPLVPITETVVFETGAIVYVLPVTLPGFQV
jgi:hypothetical protein